jgi:hypothetical protein
MNKRLVPAYSRFQKLDKKGINTMSDEIYKLASKAMEARNLMAEVREQAMLELEPNTPREMAIDAAISRGFLEVKAADCDKNHTITRPALYPWLRPG